LSSAALRRCGAAARHVDYVPRGVALDQIEVHGRGVPKVQPAFDWMANFSPAFNAISYATDLDSSGNPEDPGPQVIWPAPKRNRTIPFGEIVTVTPRNDSALINRRQTVNSQLRILSTGND
jgi:hypothetical protein